MATKAEPVQDSDPEVVITDIEAETSSKQTTVDKPEMDSEIEFKKAVEKAGEHFIYEVLPKVTTMSNGMKLLGLEETNPLTKGGDIYKIRTAHPDQPIGYSEVWADKTTIRLTQFSKLLSDEIHLSSFRIEVACFAPGCQDEDVVGVNGIKGLYAATDTCTLTLIPFIKRKISG